MSEENTGTAPETKAEETEQAPQATKPEQKNENWIPKSRFDQVNQQKKEMAETLSDLVEELKADIPENMQDLIPNTAPTEQIKWIRNAKSKGLFTAKGQSGPDSEAPTKTTKTDFSNLSTADKMQAGYKK